jgi:hypothetical protein
VTRLGSDIACDIRTCGWIAAHSVLSASGEYAPHRGPSETVAYQISGSLPICGDDGPVEEVSRSCRKVGPRNPFRDREIPVPITLEAQAVGLSAPQPQRTGSVGTIDR